MKKWLCLILSLMLLLSLSSAHADAQSDFFAFVDAVCKGTPNGFFEYPGQLFHSPIFKSTESAEDVFGDETKRCSQTASQFLEVLMLKRYSPAAAEYFGDLIVEADFSTPSYIGRDGNILRFYVQGVDAGYFTIYDSSSQLMYLDFIPLDVTEQVRSILFEKCADGYFINDASTLQQEMEQMIEVYTSVMNQMLGID